MKYIVESREQVPGRRRCATCDHQRGWMRGGLLVALGASLCLHALILGWPDSLAPAPDPVVGWRLSGVNVPLAVRLEAVGERLRSPLFTPPAVLSHGDVAPTTPVPVEQKPASQETRYPRPNESAGHAAFVAEEPPRLLTPVYIDTLIGPDTEGFVIRFRIHVNATGRAERVEIVDSWLDAKAVDQLRRSLMDADYQPARRAGMPVAGELEGGLAIEAPDKEKGPAIADPSSMMPPR